MIKFKTVIHEKGKGPIGELNHEVRDAGHAALLGFRKYKDKVGKDLGKFYAEVTHIDKNFTSTHQGEYFAETINQTED